MTEGNQKNEAGTGWNFRARKLAGRPTLHRKPVSFVNLAACCESRFGVWVDPEDAIVLES